jgi:very-short-patch-repair endonuclease
MVSAIVERARALRRGQTQAEARLWGLLRNRAVGVKFRRQVPVGPFFADFACLGCKLIVEADGGQHAESEADVARTAWLEARGWCVVRLWNDEILRNPEGVLGMILAAISERPSPSHR